MQHIILLHGALGSHHDLEPLSKKLEQDGFQTHLFSFSGHNHTSFETGFGIDQFSAELENYIVNNKLSCPHVFGYSMGGFVSLNLARKKPQLIDKIITLGTKFKWTTEVIEKETKILNADVMMQKIPGYAGVLKEKHGPSWDQLLTKTAGLMREIGSVQHLTHEHLSKIENSVLIGLGDKDKMVTYEETFNVFKSLPNAGMYMLPNTPHQLEAANTEILAKIILEFCKPS
ncbi:MAG: glyoxalase family protein [Bacteroidetes bacterium]|jgi:esterase/lipase|nr:glyoxalase family protein [Bacteroidota bacterium]